MTFIGRLCFKFICTPRFQVPDGENVANSILNVNHYYSTFFAVFSTNIAFLSTYFAKTEFWLNICVGN
jgi:hypothetical protein